VRIFYEGIIENGQIKLPDGVHLQEHLRVLIVVPDVGEAQFTVVTDIDGLPLIRATGGTISSHTVKDIEGAVG